MDNKTSVSLVHWKMKFGKERDPLRKFRAILWVIIIMK